MDGVCVRDAGGAAALLWLPALCRWLDVNSAFKLALNTAKPKGLCRCVCLCGGAVQGC